MKRWAVGLAVLVVVTPCTRGGVITLHDFSGHETVITFTPGFGGGPAPGYGKGEGPNSREGQTMRCLPTNVALVTICAVAVSAAEKDPETGPKVSRTVLSEEVVTIQSVSRKWKDNSGKHVAEGILQRVTKDGVVGIETADGTITKLDFDTLCEADQSLIKKGSSD